MISDYNKGDSLKDLQYKYQAKSSAISLYFKRNGVKLRKKGYVVHNGRIMHHSKKMKLTGATRAPRKPTHKRVARPTAKPATNGHVAAVVTIPSGLSRDAFIELAAPLYANGISFKFGA